MARASSRRRRVLRWLLAASLAAFAVLVLLLPTILSSPVVTRRIAAALGERLGARIEVGAVRLSWFGGQEAEGLRIASPGSSDPGDDILRASRISIGSGLLGLIASSAEPIRVEIDDPALRISRGRDGRFNFEGLLGGDGGGKTPEGERRPGKEGGATTPRKRRSARSLVVAVRGGSLTYRDDLLEAASRIEGLAGRVELGPSDLVVEAQGSILEDGGKPGSLHASGFARNLGLEGSEPVVQARAEVKDLDLRPYRALMERFLRVGAPERPVTGTLAVASGETELDVEADLDAGFGRIDRLTCAVPRRGAGRDASVTVPFSLDLPGTLSFLGPRAGLPPGARVDGRISGSLLVTGPVTLDALASGGAGSAPLSLRLDAKGEDLDVLWPRSGRGEAGPTGPAAESLRIQRKAASLLLRATAGGGDGAIRLDDGRLDTEGIDVRLSGSVIPGRPPPEAGEDGGRVVEVALSFGLAVPDLVSVLGPSLSPRLEISPESAIRVDGLSLRGEGGKGDAAPATWKGKGRVEVRGPLRYGGLSMARLSSELVVDGKRIELPGLACDFNGGEIHADQLSLDLAGTPEYRLSIRAEGVAATYDMAPVLAYVLPFISPVEREAELSGTIASTVELRGKGFGLDDLRKTLQGRGSLRIAEGRIGASPFIRELASVLHTDLDRVVFHEIGSDFDIGDGRVACGKVVLQGKEGGKVRSIALRGVTGMDGSLDYGMELASLRDAVGDKRVRRVLEYAEKFLGSGMLPLRLRGTLSSPRLALETAAGGLDLGGILEGRIPLPGGATDTRPPEGTEGEKEGAEPGEGRKAPQDAIQRGLDDILDAIRKRRERSRR